LHDPATAIHSPVVASQGTAAESRLNSSSRFAVFTCSTPELI
jgi:hypothetical protein